MGCCSQMQNIKYDDTSIWQTLWNQQGVRVHFSNSKKSNTLYRYHAFWRRAVWYAFMNFFWKDLSKNDTWCIVLFLIFKIPRLPHWLSGNPRGIKLNLSMRWNVECQFFWKVIKIKLNDTSLALTQRFHTISTFFSCPLP